MESATSLESMMDSYKWIICYKSLLTKHVLLTVAVLSCDPWYNMKPHIVQIPI